MMFNTTFNNISVISGWPYTLHFQLFPKFISYSIYFIYLKFEIGKNTTLTRLIPDLYFIYLNWTWPVFYISKLKLNCILLLRTYLPHYLQFKVVFLSNGGYFQLEPIIKFLCWIVISYSIYFIYLKFEIGKNTTLTSLILNVLTFVVSELCPLFEWKITIQLTWSDT
jgi:hypothetical protein